jgi:hypothetical protein
MKKIEKDLRKQFKRNGEGWLPLSLAMRKSGN